MSGSALHLFDSLPTRVSSFLQSGSLASSASLVGSGSVGSSSVAATSTSGGAPGSPASAAATGSGVGTSSPGSASSASASASGGSLLINKNYVADARCDKCNSQGTVYSRGQVRLFAHLPRPTLLTLRFCADPPVLALLPVRALRQRPSRLRRRSVRHVLQPDGRRAASLDSPLSACRLQAAGLRSSTVPTNRVFLIPAPV